MLHESTTITFSIESFNNKQVSFSTKIYLIRINFFEFFEYFS